ncbi:hypothetical protein D9M71_805860 [compost metagenome]
MRMGNWIKRAPMLLLLSLLLTGCGSRSIDCARAGRQPAVPSLPSSARQESLPSWCSPNCLKALTVERENWRQRLTEVE